MVIKSHRLLQIVILMTLATAIDARSSDLSYDRVMHLESSSETSANANLGDVDADGDLDIVVPRARLGVDQSGRTCPVDQWQAIDSVGVRRWHGDSGSYPMGNAGQRLASEDSG